MKQNIVCLYVRVKNVRKNKNSEGRQRRNNKAYTMDDDEKKKKTNHFCNAEFMTKDRYVYYVPYALDHKLRDFPKILFLYYNIYAQQTSNDIIIISLLLN